MPSRSSSQWTVSSDAAGETLAKFLAASDRLGSRGRAVAAIERGKIFVNDIEATSADVAMRLKPGDTVRLWIDRPGSARRRRSIGPAGAGDLCVVYEDEALIVVDKPPGVLSVPLERKSEAVSVFHQIEDHLRSRGKQRPLVIHRIDRDTSGLVVFARDVRAQENLRAQFRRREPERVYLAVVYGHPKPREGTWHDRLVWDSRMLIQRQTRPDDPSGKEAVSDYRVLESFAGTSLIEVRLRTGKRNQIRIQARLRGHTLVGEKRYVFGPGRLRPIDFPRQALHAHRLAFRHPVDGTLLRFEAPLPGDMSALLMRLRRSARRTQQPPSIMKAGRTIR